MKTKNRFIQGLRYFAENWNRICLLIGFSGSVLLYILSDIFPDLQTSNEISTAFIYFTGGALIFVLLDIHKELKREIGDDTETNFTAARPRMLDEIAKETRRSLQEPLVIRLVGMRLSAIQQFLADLAYVARNGEIGRRSMRIVVYHVDPEYLVQQRPVTASEIQVPAETRFQQQAAALAGVIGELKAMYASVPNTSIEVANYRNIPFFWAVDVGRRCLFWGFFTWEKKEQNWVGPENRCIVYRADTAAGGGEVLRGVLNRIDALEDWSKPSLSDVA